MTNHDIILKNKDIIISVTLSDLYSCCIVWVILTFICCVILVSSVRFLMLL